MPPPTSSAAPRGWVHAHSATMVDLFRIVDALWILAGLWLATQHMGVTWGHEQLMAGLLAVGVFATCTGIWPLYRSWRVARLRVELGRTAQCWFVTIAGVDLIGNAAGSLVFQEDARLLILVWGTVTLAGLLGTRILLRSVLRLQRLRGGNYRTVAIIGANETGQAVAQQMQRSTWMGLRLVGHFDDRAPNVERIAPGLTVAGNYAELLRRIHANEIDIVYIALPLRSELRIHQIVNQLRDSTVSVYYVPDFTAFGLLRASWDTMGGMPIVNVIDTPHQGIHAMSKRAFDIVVSSFILAFIALPMLLIAAAIKLTSPGPAIFRQRRDGLDGREFEIWKFRTMTVCEDGKAEFRQAVRNDARVTPLGAFLRRTSLDELPQFINVLQGRMSIVGPRPHPVALNAAQRRLIDGYMLRHKVKPGITGWAQVNGYRGETDTHDKMLGRIRLDLDYIHNWSLWLDFRILVLTLVRGLSNPNAY
ncbi:undecaprenyl-phosphate glucose phosphotransferase [Burkholderiaceae bacterium]|nr:undecaprenyl-phosphate glucose phosphotransferase [Burkholderiaceae bacterium]